MAYDEDLAERIRELLAGEEQLSEKRMFGGLAFLLGGRMAVCANRAGTLMVRVDPAETDDLVADPVADRMIMNGRAMDGWLTVELGPDAEEAVLESWVRRGVAFARTLPPKG